MTILTAPSPLISGSRPRFKPYVARAGPKVCMTRRWSGMDSNFRFRARMATVPSLRALSITTSECALRRQAQFRFAHDSPLEGDGFELPVREHRAMAPNHGFAAASHREAVLRGAPASLARPRSESQRGSVRPAANMRSTHREMRCSAAVQAAR